MSRLVKIVACTLLLLTAGCASYQFGARTLFPADIRTVHVPVFESVSFRRGLGERLTEAVVKEIERRTPYKVVGDAATADSILSGRLLHDAKKTLIETRTDESRAIEVEMILEVSWLNRRGASIAGPQAIPLEPGIAEIDQTAIFIPEAGQSMVTAQQRVIDNLASQIVNMMEMPW